VIYNRSGIVVKELVDEFNLSLNDLLIIYDDTNLEVGEIRIRKSGSDGGHNGLKSIIYHLENDRFIRLRVGIGEPGIREELAEYVLSQFPKEELKIIEEKLPLILGLIDNFIIGGVDDMLNYYSREANIKSSNIS
jgi:PTH1 family peptidyl-tRNA hydrolase